MTNVQSDRYFPDKESLRRGFDDLLAGVFCDYRSMERVLCRVVRTLSDRPDWTLLDDGGRHPLDGLRGVELRRGGYILEIVRLSGIRRPSDLDPITRALTRLPDEGGEGELFFPGSFVQDETQDDLARRWGLAGGVILSRVRQSLRPPYVN